ncbi:MAG: ATP-binding protein [Deltaproteobacteria bacterium]|nr:ATP-binding protein [Deltaproteobacteria bacterium]
MNRFPNANFSFEEVRKRGLKYVDKTEHALRLLTSYNNKTSFFLSRPRRFGKSLFLSTLKSALEGKSALFDGLAMNRDSYGFEKHPVIHLDMGYIDSSSLDSFNGGMNQLIAENRLRSGLQVDLSASLFIQNLSSLISALHFSTGGKAAILIDEYDKPILNELGNKPLVNDLINKFNTFSSVLKSGVGDGKIGFVFLTGVTKISHTSIFSGGNDVIDVSLDRRFADVCGFTKEEIRRHFSESLESILPVKDWSGNLIKSLDGLLAKIYMKYDGYSWDGKTKVINPFSMINFLETREFDDFWFNTGTPTFLVKLASGKRGDLNFLALEDTALSKKTFNAVSVNNLALAPLMFQAGYLTVKSFLDDGSLILGIPNGEVRQAFAHLTLGLLTGEEADAFKSRLSADIRKAVLSGDDDEIRDCLVKIINFSTYENIKPGEGFYNALFTGAFVVSGLDAWPERSTVDGKLDIFVRLPSDIVRIFELKYSKTADGVDACVTKAREQLNDRNYRNTFIARGLSVHELIVVVAERQSVFVKTNGIFDKPTARA